MKIAYLFFASLMFVNVASNFLEKKGMTMLPKITSFTQLYSVSTVKAVITNPFIVSGICLSAIGIMLWLGALSSLKLSYLVPLAGVSYILTAIVSWLILGEHISPMQWLGTAVIVLGVFLINQK